MMKNIREKVRNIELLDVAFGVSFSVAIIGAIVIIALFITTLVNGNKMIIEPNTESQEVTMVDECGELVELTCQIIAESDTVLIAQNCDDVNEYIELEPNEMLKVGDDVIVCLVDDEVRSVWLYVDC